MEPKYINIYKVCILYVSIKDGGQNDKDNTKDIIPSVVIKEWVKSYAKRD